MDQAPPISMQVAENISEGMNCLYEIAIASDAQNAPVLSKMRDALYIMKAGVQVRTDSKVDDSMITHLDAIIAMVSKEGFSMDDARALAAQYLAELERRWTAKE